MGNLENIKAIDRMINTVTFWLVMSDAAKDVAAAAKLWEYAEQVTGIVIPPALGNYLPDRKV